MQWVSNYFWPRPKTLGERIAEFVPLGPLAPLVTLAGGAIGGPMTNPCTQLIVRPQSYRFNLIRGLPIAVVGYYTLPLIVTGWTWLPWIWLGYELYIKTRMVSRTYHATRNTVGYLMGQKEYNRNNQYLL
jgi:hypothetical protein